jgi:hypothetical protein
MLVAALDDSTERQLSLANDLMDHAAALRTP